MQTFTRQGLTFDVDDHGPADGEPVLLLHGFPQTRAMWGQVADRLAHAGYRSLVPDQRGYSPGARPRGRRAYHVANLVADAAALARAAGAGPVHVVGHDWGAIVAWMLAAHRPEVVRSVTAVSVPHPGAFVDAILTTRQVRNSSYMFGFQLPVLPERALERTGLAELMVRTGLPRAAAERDAVALEGALTGPLNWYRALPLLTPARRRTPVDRPALLVWGAKDPFVTRIPVDANADFMRGDYRLEVLPRAGHWIPDRNADTLADLVLDRIRSA